MKNSEPQSQANVETGSELKSWISEAAEELVIDLEFGGELDFTNEPVNTRDTVIRNFARIIAKHEPSPAPKSEADKEL